MFGRADGSETTPASRTTRGPRKPRRLAQTPGEPVAPQPKPQRSDGHLRFHMDVARTQRRASPKLTPCLAVLHSFAVTGPTARSRRRLNHDRRGATLNPLKVAG